MWYWDDDTQGRYVIHSLGYRRRDGEYENFAGIGLFESVGEAVEAAIDEFVHHFENNGVVLEANLKAAFDPAGTKKQSWTVPTAKGDVQIKAVTVNYNDAGDPVDVRLELLEPGDKFVYSEARVQRSGQGASASWVRKNRDIAEMFTISDLLRIEPSSGGRAMVYPVAINLGLFEDISAVVDEAVGAMVQLYETGDSEEIEAAANPPAKGTLDPSKTEQRFLMESPIGELLVMADLYDDRDEAGANPEWHATVFLHKPGVYGEHLGNVLIRHAEDWYSGPRTQYQHGSDDVEGLWVIYDPRAAKGAPYGIGGRGHLFENPTDAFEAYIDELVKHYGALESKVEASKFDSEFLAWFGGSKVVDDKGKPLLVYRGEHGNTDFQSRRASLSFGTESAARTYARTSNDREDIPQNPRVTGAYLSIKNPILNSPDDPFIEFSDLVNKVGLDDAVKIARLPKVAEACENTSNWQEGLADEYGVASVTEFLDADPERVALLYCDAYVILDAPEAVSVFKAAGYDGAIHGGNGETAGEVEYKVFSPAQVRKVSTIKAAQLTDFDKYELDQEWSYQTPIGEVLVQYIAADDNNRILYFNIRVPREDGSYVTAAQVSVSAQAGREDATMGKIPEDSPLVYMRITHRGFIPLDSIASHYDDLTSAIDEAVASVVNAVKAQRAEKAEKVATTQAPRSRALEQARRNDPRGLITGGLTAAIVNPPLEEALPETVTTSLGTATLERAHAGAYVVKQDVPVGEFSQTVPIGLLMAYHPIDTWGKNILDPENPEFGENYDTSVVLLDGRYLKYTPLWDEWGPNHIDEFNGFYANGAEGASEAVTEIQRNFFAQIDLDANDRAAAIRELLRSGLPEEYMRYLKPYGGIRAALAEGLQVVDTVMGLVRVWAGDDDDTQMFFVGLPNPKDVPQDFRDEDDLSAFAQFFVNRQKETARIIEDEIVKVPGAKLYRVCGGRPRDVYAGWVFYDSKEDAIQETAKLAAFILREELEKLNGEKAD